MVILVPQSHISHAHAALQHILLNMLVDAAQRFKGAWEFCRLGSDGSIPTQKHGHTGLTIPRGDSAQRQARLYQMIPLAWRCLRSLYCMPVTINLSASPLQYETQVSLCNSCLSSPIPPSPPECNKCPAIIYFNSLPSCTDEMDS